MGQQPTQSYLSRRLKLENFFSKFSLNNVEQDMIKTIIQIGQKDLNPKVIQIEGKLNQLTKNQQNLQTYGKIAVGIAGAALAYLLYNQIVKKERDHHH